MASTEEQNRPWLESLVLLSFFLSGFAALVYEVSWLRLAGLYFESTAYSAATVVAIFMAGLGLGSLLSGRVARRSRDLALVYFNLEALIGLVALLIPLVFTAVRPIFGVIYRSSYDSQFVYHMLRILLSALIMLPPTVLMGMTLPILIEALTHSYSKLSKRAGLLYGVNSAGAAAGAALAGFVLLPRLGTWRSTLVGVAVNLSIALAGYLVLGRFPWSVGRMAGAIYDAKKALTTRRYILVAFAISGFCALSYEIVWTRLLIASIGPASYSFATVLSCFVLGLAVGSAVYAALSERIRNKVFSCGVLIVLTGLAATVAALLLPGLPRMASRLIAENQHSFGALVGVKYMLAGAVILPLTLFSGALFPAAASAYVPDADRLSERIGRLYAGNSLGAIAGSLIAGFVLLPAMGAHRAVVPVIILQLALGLYIVGKGKGFRWASCLVPVPLAAVLVLLFRPAADPRLLYGGGYIYFWQYEEVSGGEVPVEMRTLLYHEDGPGGTVTVSRSSDGTRTFLAIDGKTDGSNDPSDMTTQSMLAHLPMVMHGHPGDVLIIGLGTGTTYATALGYAAERVRCVEVSEEVIEASRFFYGAYDSTRMSDPRGEVVLGDGRSLLFFRDDKYDVIIAEPSNPWLSGMGNLFTFEYFQAMRGRLREGGVCCQWLHGYRLSPHTFKSVVKTFAAVFPHASLWWVNITGGDFLLLGSDEKPLVSLSDIDHAVSTYGIRNYFHPEGAMSAYSFLRRFVAADLDLRGYAGDGRLITDDSAFLEYYASREMYTQVLDVLHRDLSDLSRPALEILKEPDARDPAVREKLEVYEDNRRAFMEYIYTDSAADPWTHPVYLAKRNDWMLDEDISVAVGQSMTGYAEQLYLNAQNMPYGEERRRRIQNILRGYTEALNFIEPREIDIENIAVLYRDIGELRTSLATLDAAFEMGFESVGMYEIKGEVLYALATGEIAGMQGAEMTGEQAESRRLKAAAYLEEAASAYRSAAEVEPANVSHWLNLGAIMRALGDYESARAYWQRALAIDPENDGARRGLATLER
ncbi:MAG: fused MFS/spermidine synthase [bacterium]